MPLPESINALVAALGKLPGIGPRSAERIAQDFAPWTSGLAPLLS